MFTLQKQKTTTKHTKNNLKHSVFLLSDNKQILFLKMSKMPLKKGDSSTRMDQIGIVSFLLTS